MLLGATRAVGYENGSDYFSLDIFDLADPLAEITRIRLDFCGHGIALRPIQPNKAAVFEKGGRSGCIVDLGQLKIDHALTPMPGRTFYGHGAYSDNEDLLFIVEAGHEDAQGVVSVRDTSTCTVIASVPTYGFSPHDCKLIEGGKTLVVANAGGRTSSGPVSSLSFIDVASGKLIEQYDEPDHRRGIGHFAILGDLDFVAVSAPREAQPFLSSVGSVTLQRRGEQPVRLADDVAARLTGEALSVVIHRPSRTAVVAHPSADLVTFWALDTGELVKALETPAPRGVAVTPDEETIIISYGAQARLLLVEMQDLRPVAGPRLAGVFGGAHLYTFSAC